MIKNFFCEIFNKKLWVFQNNLAYTGYAIFTTLAKGGTAKNATGGRSAFASTKCFLAKRRFTPKVWSKLTGRLWITLLDSIFPPIRSMKMYPKMQKIWSKSWFAIVRFVFEILKLFFEPKIHLTSFYFSHFFVANLNFLFFLQIWTSLFLQIWTFFFFVNLNFLENLNIFFKFLLKIWTFCES